jgi:hypothetical protein
LEFALVSILIALSLTANPGVDKYAHFGVAHASTHAAYELCALIHGDKFDLTTHVACSLISAFAVNAAGLIWENEGNHSDADLAANLIGTASSQLLIQLHYSFR